MNDLLEGEPVANEQQPWGRVDDDGTVYVREGDGERAVGQYPDGTPEEALAYFERKYTDLAGQVGLLEQRARRGAPASDIAKAVNALRATLADANAVGDLEALRNRLAALTGTVDELTEQQSEAARAAMAEALAYREALVVEAEQLAASDPAKMQWKQVTAQLDDIFARWQKHQQEGPRLRRNEANELWKRFRAARSTLEQHRKAFFAELDAAHKDARSKKQALVERAEALTSKGADGIPEYRRLLEDWKRAGRAGKKLDDALWAKFKAAGDQLYQAKSEIDARDDEEYRQNLEQKLALLDGAEPILAETDRIKAREALSGIQRKWDEIGRVPRDQMKQVEERLRKIEQHVRKLDDEHWERNNPERKARSEGLASQLEESIASLQADIAKAEAAGDAKKAEEARAALETQRAWLAAIG
ncbi:DUF349 domain-containing protein [Ruicaihuangia caeni]|uniref:DUF349 domain-containing protein n=1 Tax=Ruicaihuangia caeni TaxID=3042517 RepID=A0AAW6T3N5_9MICO|nr:DUF349 domain-containing protein [Klugiella sp. YN-L-19]MDI2098054.1 DUF349 domain-containing protein [Klugiella sp. YN-L-19]